VNLKGCKSIVFADIKDLQNSFQVDNDVAQILMAVVKYKTSMYLPRHGLCSTWLASLQPFNSVDDKETVQVWINKGTILFPKDDDSPVIMVGPGKYNI